MMNTVDAQELMTKLADAAWRCADPGIQYDTTINRWHTCPDSGRINASNPCSEYMHVDDSACNLASLNLMRFRRDGRLVRHRGLRARGRHRVPGAGDRGLARRATRPRRSASNARAFRQLGLGYANLGALLMSNGLPYDSDDGRNVAAAITALMTGRGYRKSAEVAAAIGPYEAYEQNREPHNAVMRMHRDASYEIDDTGVKGELLDAAAAQLGRGGRARRRARLPQRAGDGAGSDRHDLVPDGLRHDGHRARLLAGQVQGAGRRRADDDRQPARCGWRCAALGYYDAEVEQIEAHINEHSTIVGAPALKDEHLEVFDVAVGERAISHMGHIKMMAATQPFISGAISKTVNLPRDGDGRGHRRRLHPGLAARHQGARDLPRRLEDRAGAAHRRGRQGRRGRRGAETAAPVPARHKMPVERESITHKFSLGGHEGYITAGKYEDGSVGEIFLTDIGKEGSTIKGLMNAFATAVSIGLQYGVPLETFVEKFAYVRFEPEGITKNPEIPFAKSLPDYIMRWLASRFLDADYQEELGILTPEVRARKELQQTLFVNEGPAPSSRRRRLRVGRRRGAEGRRRQRQLEAADRRRSPTRPRSARRAWRASSSARPATSAAA